MMRKSFRLLCVGTALAAVLGVPAFAVEDSGCAERLHELGLFEGTQQGYDLDRTPTRAEAAVMLVRLLGAEKDAKLLQYTAPFTDLKGWEAPYIQYLYQNELTAGTTETTFNPAGACSAQMYATFLLRALGYSEQAGDFTYDTAVDFARSIGVYDMGIDIEEFRREDIAQASYTALSVSPAGQDGTLLDCLLQSGAVSGTAVKRCQQLFTNYAEYREATAGMDRLESYSVDTELVDPAELTIGNRNITLQTQATATFNRSTKEIQLERTVSLSTPNVEDKATASAVRLSDGVLYRRAGGSQQKNTLSEKEQELLFAMYGRVPLAYIEDVEKTANGDGWTVKCRAVPSVYKEVIWPLESTIGSMDDAELHHVTIKHNVKDGEIISQDITVDFQKGDVSGMPVFVSKLDKTDNGLSPFV